MSKQSHSPKKPGDVIHHSEMSNHFTTATLIRLKHKKIGHKTYRGRYPWHNNFFHSDYCQKTITSFADIGCAATNGAPLTFEAREILPSNVQVFGVELPVFFNPKTAEMMKSVNIHPIALSISDVPLPKPVDVIRFSHVSYYMSEYEFKKAMGNIYGSLKDDGYLLDEQALYQKVDGGFKFISGPHLFGP